MRVDKTAEPLSQAIAAEVRAEMARQRISQQALGVKLGTTQAYLSRRLTGDVEFGVGELMRIADVLGVPLSQFLPAPARAT